VKPKKVPIGLQKLIKSLRCKVQEDPLRATYLLCLEFSSFRTIDVTELMGEMEITDGIFQVFYGSDKMSYILKIVNWSLYQLVARTLYEKNWRILSIFKGCQVLYNQLVLQYLLIFT
jgi:hypothetical protein